MNAELRGSGRTSLATASAIASATLGLIMTAGSVALALAIVSTPQPPQQAVTAAVLFATGLVNLSAVRGIRRETRGAVLASACATIVGMIYLGAVLKDFGEPFWLHGVYLSLLLLLSYQARLRWT